MWYSFSAPVWPCLRPAEQWRGRLAGVECIFPPRRPKCILHRPIGHRFHRAGASRYDQYDRRGRDASADLDYGRPGHRHQSGLAGHALCDVDLYLLLFPGPIDEQLVSYGFGYYETKDLLRFGLILFPIYAVVLALFAIYYWPLVTIGIHP